MAITQAIGAVSGDVPLVGAAAAAVLAAVVLQALLRWAGFGSLSKIPIYGTHLGTTSEQRTVFLTGASSMYLEGYRKFKEGVFRLATARSVPVVVISPKFLQELQKLPDDVLSFPAAVRETMHTRYTQLLSESREIVHTIKADLTPALVRLNPLLNQEVMYAIDNELGAVPDWTEVHMHAKLLRIVALASSRIFLGKELSRQEAYLRPAIEYTVDIIRAVRAVNDLQTWKRPFYARHLPEVKQIEQHEREAVDFLRPVVRARLEARKDPNYQRSDDMLEWLMDRMLAEQGGKVDEKQLAKLQLTLSFAAIHTTTTTATNSMYTLAAMPEIVPELRKEVIDVLAKNDGKWTSLTLQSMKKLDSFIRENMRFHSMGPVAFMRKVLKPFTLSNGTRLPAGVCIEIPAVGVNHDDDIYPDADRFDPWRYSRLREETAGVGGTRAAEVAARNQTVSVNPQHLTFGFGRHACPGRFFAANEIKMILASVLLNYDIKLVGTTERYKNVEMAGQNFPDPTKTIMVKRVS